MSVAARTITKGPPREDRLHPRFIGAVRGEILKVARQRATWVMLGIAVLLFALVVIGIATAPGPRDQVRTDPLGFLYQALNIFLFVFDAGAGIFLLIVSARLVAMEYNAGTIRVLLARGTGRVPLLLAKLITLALVALVLFVGFILLSTVAVYALVVSWTGSFNAITTLPAIAWHNLMVNICIGLISIAINILLGTTAAVLGRSLAFAMGAALAFFPADNLGTLIFFLINRLTHQHFFLDVTAYLLGPNLNVLQSALQPDHRVGGSFAQPLVPVDGTHALAVVAVWAMAFLIVSLVLTGRRDVLE